MSNVYDMTITLLKWHKDRKIRNTLYFFTGKDLRNTQRERLNGLIKSQHSWLVAEFPLEPRIPNILYSYGSHACGKCWNPTTYREREQSGEKSGV